MDNKPKTYGELKTIIQNISAKQKGEKVAGIAVDVIIGLVPGLEAAKKTFDFIKAVVTKPDDKKTKTWIDNLDIDDNVSAIVDDTVENGFMKYISQIIDSKDNEEIIDPEFFNMNAKMKKYLQDKYNQRYIAGIKEGKVDKERLLQIKKGVKAEMEHTKKIKDKKVATKMALKIALDHLGEDPKYYDKLKKAGLEELNEGEFCPQCLAQYIRDHINVLHEAEYKGRKVQLGKPMAGDVKKFKVYVKNAKGNVVKVNFGQKGVKIKKNNPERRKSFRARHHCDTNPGPRWKARYWSCRKW